MTSLEQVIDYIAHGNDLVRRALKILIPISIISGIFLVFGLTDVKYVAAFIKMFSAYIVPFVGTPASVAIGLHLGLDPAVVVFWLTTIEVSGAFLVWLNFELLESAPILGKYLTKSEARGRRYISKHPWAGKFTILGVVAFVLIPIEGAGAFTAPIIGRILAMDLWKVLVAVLIAAILRFGAWTGGFGTLFAVV